MSMYLSPQHVVQAAWDWAELLPALWAELQAVRSVQVGAWGLFFWDQLAAQGMFFPGNDRRTSPTLQAHLKLLLALYLLICHWPKQVTWLSPKWRGRNVLSISLRGARQSHGQALHQWAVTSSLLTEVKGRKWTDAEFVSHGCSLKWPQSWWLKTTEIYTVTDTEARSSESGSLIGGNRVVLPPEALVENLNSSNCWWLPAFLGLWPYHYSLQGQHLQISLYSIILPPALRQTPLSFSLIWTLLRVFKAHLHNPDNHPHLEILNLIISVKSSPCNIIFTVFRD